MAVRVASPLVLNFPAPRRRAEPRRGSAAPLLRQVPARAVGLPRAEIRVASPLSPAPPSHVRAAPPTTPPLMTSAAVLVGILGGSGTTLTMVPANLVSGPRADVTLYTIVSLDAGVY